MAASEKKITVKSTDVLVVRGRHPDWGYLKYLKETTGVDVVISGVSSLDDIQFLDEERMRELGWVRVGEG